MYGENITLTTKKKSQQKFCNNSDNTNINNINIHRIYQMNVRIAHQSPSYGPKRPSCIIWDGFSSICKHSCRIQTSMKFFPNLEHAFEYIDFGLCCCTTPQFRDEMSFTCQTIILHLKENSLQQPCEYRHDEHWHSTGLIGLNDPWLIGLNDPWLIGLNDPCLIGLNDPL